MSIDVGWESCNGLYKLTALSCLSSLASPHTAAASVQANTPVSTHTHTVAKYYVIALIYAYIYC